MSGRRARQGFQYQDGILIERLLRDVVARRRAEIEGTPAPPSRSFLLESSPNNESSPDWDIVQITSPTPPVLEEVKSGAVDAQDRKTLWKRVRRSVAGLPSEPALVVRLVVDHDNPPTLHDAWSGVAAAARSATVPSSAPPRVTSTVGLAEEALFYLTTSEGGVGSG